MAQDATSDDKWMEIFHSKPSMATCYFLEKLPSGEFATPSPSNMLLDASHVRDGFRVMRRRATRVEFALTNGTDRNWDDNGGSNYVIDGVPGRYVVEHGIRRVGDADVMACRQMVLRPGDRFIHMRFRADLWSKCFANFQINGKTWTEAPGVEMTLVQRPDLDGRQFELVVEATRLAVAFNDGGEVWDGNQGSNYLVGLPGMYEISSDRGVVYLSSSEKDLKDNPSGALRPTAAAKTSAILKSSGVPNPQPGATVREVLSQPSQ